VSRTAAEERLALGSAAVVPLTVAARWLPWGQEDAIAWLRQRGLVREVPDVPGGAREIVIWGEVLDALRGIVASGNKGWRTVAKVPPGKLPDWTDPED
jgi:hypothetical protein